jgi:hypothetical protein
MSASCTTSHLEIARAYNLTPLLKRPICVTADILICGGSKNAWFGTQKRRASWVLTAACLGAPLEERLSVDGDSAH